jgi:flavin reductase (DIM6/NTAB) family NADH-FMN oxidoreductase RutF
MPVFYKTSEPHGLPHNPFKSCVAPRPIAWVSSMHPNGAINLAPYSFFNALASDPEFVVNMVPLALKDAMNATTADVAHEVDELELAGLTTEASELVKPPRVREAPIHLECAFFQEIELPCTLQDSINTMIIGKVLGVHIRDEVLVDGLVDLTLIKPLARLGYMQYTSVDQLFSMARPRD